MGLISEVSLRLSTEVLALPGGRPPRWTLMNIELWGRLNMWNEGPEDY